MIIIRIDNVPCAINVCRNGGVCQRVENGYTCQCPAGYAGLNCETAMTPCSDNVCQNGGVCLSSGSVYICQCPAGYSGVNCLYNGNLHQ